MSKMPNTSTSDREFDRLVSLREAYQVMERFVSDYLARGDTTVVEFLVYLGLHPDGTSGDPAAADDYLEAADSVLGSDSDS